LWQVMQRCWALLAAGRPPFQRLQTPCRPRRRRIRSLSACLDAPALLPCGHRCVCAGCAESMRACLICRGGGPRLGALLRQRVPSSPGGLFLHSVSTSPRGQKRRRQRDGRRQHNTAASTYCRSAGTRTREAYRRAVGKGLQGYLANKKTHPPRTLL